MQTLVLVGNNPVLNAGLSSIISQIIADTSILEFPDTNSFDSTFTTINPGIVIFVIDTANEAECMLQLLRIRKFFLGTPVVIYDNELELSKLPAYLRADVQGYISKKSDLSEINECLTAVQRGKKYLGNDAMNWVIYKYADGKTEYSRTSHVTGGINLTRHQLIIANYLAAGMRPTQIAEKLGKKNSTISTIKATIFKKMNVVNVVDLKTLLEMHK